MNRLPLVASIPLLLLAATAHADINGFGDFSGFKINQNDAGSPPSSPAAGTIQLMTGFGQLRSIFNLTPQNITSFTASFTYQRGTPNNNDGYSGFTFVLEQDPRGASAVTNDYHGFGFTGITKSIGIDFELYNNQSGLFTNGAIGTGQSNVSPVNLSSGHPINVQLSYNGSTLVEDLTDATTLQHYSKNFLILTPFATTIGSSTAYVGLSAYNGDSNTQTFSNFQFTSGASAIPEPATLSALALPALLLLARRRRSTR